MREIANTQKVSAATGIMYGLALRYLRCIIPVICLRITTLVSHSFCGMFGVTLAALGMHSTLTMGLSDRRLRTDQRQRGWHRRDERTRLGCAEAY